MSIASQLSNKRFMTVSCLLGICTIAYLSSWLNYYLQSRENEVHKASFVKAALLIEEKLNSYVRGLQGMNGVYYVTDFKPGQLKIRKYAEQREFFNNFPGSLGFGFIRRVPEDKLDSFLIETKKMIPNFKIHGLGFRPTNSLYVIEAIEPLEKNAPALGLDISTEITRFEAAKKSWELGIPMLTAPIELVQLNQTGFLFMAPAYSSGVPPLSLADKKDKHIGWAYSVIVASAIKEYLYKFVDHKLILNISDSGQSIIEDSRKVDSFFSDRTHLFRSDVAIGGRVWNISGATGDNTNYLLIFYFTLTGFFLLSALFIVLIMKIYKISKSVDQTKSKAFKLENWQRAILDSSTFSIISTDVDGRITTFNKSAENLLGYGANEVVGIQTLALFHDQEEVIKYTALLEKKFGLKVEPGFETFVARARVTGSDMNEWTYVTSKGIKIPVRLSVTVLRDWDDTIIGFLGLAENLSEVKEIQKALVSGAKMSALGEMASGIAHEINNPLAIISGRTSLLKMYLKKLETPELSDAGGHLKVIEDTTFRIAEIIKGLRVFSRDTSKDDMCVTQLNKVFEDTLQLCKHRLINRAIELELSGDVDLQFFGRSVQVSQVFMNLISNSVDALEDLPEKWIKIEVKQIGDMACIFFSDSGAGIPEEVAEKILQPFFTTKEIGKGTGLGLSISKGIIESHGGSLKYESQFKHTTFKITLPLC